MASLLDVGGFFLFGFTAGLLFGAVAGVVGLTPGTVRVVTTLLVWLLLPLWFCKDCFDGQSLGKVLCGVRVIDEATGAPCGVGTSFKRNLPLIIPFMPLIAAVQLCQGHRFGDGWSNTKVVWKKYADHPIFAPVKLLAEHPSLQPRSAAFEPRASSNRQLEEFHQPSNAPSTPVNGGHMSSANS